jgi:outer membrane lipoprotein-sorting protein
MESVMQTFQRTNAAATVLFAATIFFSGVAWSQAPSIDWTLKEALKEIDRQADGFQSALARVEVIRRDIEGKEVSRQLGNGYINKDGEIRLDLDEGQRTLLVERNLVSKFDGTAQQVEEYSLSKHKDRLEPFATLGFSTTGKDLDDGYLLTLLGEEQIGESRTIGIEMTPKKEKDRETVGKIRLYIDQAAWMPKRQEITDTQTNQTLVITYSNMARNLKLNPDLFKAKWPKGTKRVKK